ncbi:MAG: hypothetical protein IKZ87_05775 [Actinomycetaceae bacterium]|nr:hypothetical protein [Actinomycetaceae bacterium]
MHEQAKQTVNCDRAITPELMFQFYHNTAVVLRDVFIGLKELTPFPAPYGKSELLSVEYKTQIPDPDVAVITTHLTFAPTTKPDDIFVLLQLLRWCKETGVVNKIFSRELKEIAGGSTRTDDVLDSPHGKKFISMLASRCSAVARERIEKGYSVSLEDFVDHAISRMTLCLTWDKYDDSPWHPHDIVLVSASRATPFALTPIGYMVLDTYASMMGA